MAAKNEVQAAPAPSGVGKFMADAKLNFFELAILLAFWLGAAILSEYLSLDVILGTRAHKERRRGARRRRVRTRPVSSRTCRVPRPALATWPPRMTLTLRPTLTLTLTLTSQVTRQSPRR